jgi:hypothetical protein
MNGFCHIAQTSNDIDVEFGHDYVNGRFFVVGDVESPILDKNQLTLSEVTSLLKLYFIDNPKLSSWIAEFESCNLNS